STARPLGESWFGSTDRPECAILSSFAPALCAARIPTLQGEPNRSANASSEDPMARVLIVDDSPYQLMGMKLIIERLGHETITADDGAQGVEVAKRELPDLILMDVVMPNFNGFQATRA